MKLKSQSGRSMVEMLGVLAIIGVLSVGGIAGYSHSMSKHRANRVADVVAKYAAIAYGQCQKIILDGHASDVRGCTQSLISDYDSVGIGNKPAGVRNIATAAFSIDADGYDVASVGVGLTSKKFCQTVSSIAGTGCESTDLTFKIKLN